MLSYIISFFGSGVKQVMHIGNRGLMAFGFMHGHQAGPYHLRSCALANMDHLSHLDVVGDKQLGICVIKCPVLSTF
jgi:hypothetical protein